MRKLFILLLIPFLMGAAPTKSTTFTSGTTIRSSEVNTNFDDLYEYLQTGVDTLRDDALDATGEISDSLCSNGQILKKSSGAWACGSDSTSEGEGDAVTVNSSGADTTANLLDGTDITWTLADGGAGGPDDITGAVVDDSHNHVYSNLDAFTEANLYTILSDVTQFYEAGDEDTIAAAISEGALTDSSVVSADIKDDTIESADYAAGSIDAEHLAADVIDETKIADNGIDSEHYNDGSIDPVHLATDDFGEFSCSAGTCTIDSGVIDADNIGANAVQASELDVSDVSDDIAGDIAEGELADSSIVSADIKDGEVATADLNLTDFTCADLTISDCGAITSSGAVTATGLVVTTSLRPYVSSAEPSCSEGELFWDTDADTDGSLKGCIGNGTWKDIDDDGGGSGDSVTVNSSAVDTTANFLDGTDITWTLADGGGGGPDDITGTVVDDSHAHVITNIDAFTKANLETQTSDVSDYAEADGDTFTGVHDFGGADSFEIPNAAGGTVDAEGELTWDTTKGQLAIYSGLVTRVFYPVETRCAMIENLAAADDNLSIGALGESATVTAVGCSYVGTGTTVAEISLEDGGGNAMTHSTPVCTAAGTDFTFHPVTANGSVNAGELIRFDVDNAVDPETDEYTICYEFVWNRQ